MGDVNHAVGVGVSTGEWRVALHLLVYTSCATLHHSDLSVLAVALRWGKASHDALCATLGMVDGSGMACGASMGERRSCRRLERRKASRNKRSMATPPVANDAFEVDAWGWITRDFQDRLRLYGKPTHQQSRMGPIRRYLCAADTALPPPNKRSRPTISGLALSPTTDIPADGRPQVRGHAEAVAIRRDMLDSWATTATPGLEYTKARCTGDNSTITIAHVTASYSVAFQSLEKLRGKRVGADTTPDQRAEALVRARVRTLTAAEQE